MGYKRPRQGNLGFFKWRGDFVGSLALIITVAFIVVVPARSNRPSCCFLRSTTQDRQMKQLAIFRQRASEGNPRTDASEFLSQKSNFRMWRGDGTKASTPLEATLWFSKGRRTRTQWLTRMGRIVTEGQGGEDDKLENEDGGGGMSFDEEDLFEMRGLFQEEDEKDDDNGRYVRSGDEEMNVDSMADSVAVQTPVSTSSFHGWDLPPTQKELLRLTVPQLKQQLRLRGLRVGGRKSDLVSRLLESSASSEAVAADSHANGDTFAYIDEKRTDDNNVEVIPSSPKGSSETKAETKAQTLAAKRGKKFVDVTAYVDAGERSDDEIDNPEVKFAEVWGVEAKIVDAFDDDRPVVDNLSRTVVEFVGHNKEKVRAFVCASRDALKSYLAGGGRGPGKDNKTQAQRVGEIQRRREKAERIRQPIEGAEDKDHTGFYYIEDYTDVGLYTSTGAKVSASEVEGVLFLSDVRGPLSQDCMALCEKVAFECQPCVVMAPDLFRGKPWMEDCSNPGFNEDGEEYEEWRKGHPEERVAVDVRAGAAVLRERYGVASVVVFGTCFGGGRALEAAAGWAPKNLLDVPSNFPPPPPVEPSACIAWYPTRYDGMALFGTAGPEENDAEREKPPVAIMAIFAGEDTLAGATPDDASKLQMALASNPRVQDFMVKVFGGQKHGFAHVGLGDKEGCGLVGGEGEVAALLSTAWMETYSRVFLPTVGSKVRDDKDWSRLEMKETFGGPPYEMNQDEWWTFDFESLAKEYEDHDYEGVNDDRSK